jgi:hypothetical protein
MLSDITGTMQGTAEKIEPLVRRFVADITRDLEQLQAVDAPLDAPLADPHQHDAVRRIRARVEAFEHAMAEIHQALVTDAQRIALNWLLPGDPQNELDKVEHLPHGT